ncbi:MAG: CAP domain-containing protein [Solirubrobacteraceae bacterium]
MAISLTLSAAAAAAAVRARHHRRATSTCSGGRTAIAASTKSALRTAVVCLINQQRTSRGLPVLIADSKLDRSAQAWTDEMVAHHEFTHGADFAERITAAGFHWSQAGENIATGYPTPASVVAGWMRSAGHCENILDPAFRYVGTGVSRGATIVSPGTWTQDFGLLRGQRAPSGNRAPAAGCPYS